MNAAAAPCPICSQALDEAGLCPRCTPTEGGLDGEPTRAFTDGASLLSQRYRLIRRLGQGGMGEVWLAFDGRLKSEVALKFVAAALAGNEESRSRFFQEIRLARQVRHPNVAAVYDLFEDEGRLFFTMEYVPGHSLEEVLEQRPDLPEALHLARELCRGLAALHEAGIVHRDVKPGNVRVRPDGRLMLLDLGVAKDLSSPGLTSASWIVGTPEHMAPEQALGQAVTPAADVFATGLILYRLFTGRPVDRTALSSDLWRSRTGRGGQRASGTGPAASPSPIPLASPLLGDTIPARPKGSLPPPEEAPTLPAPSQVDPTLPPWLDRVLAACLDPDPRRRYPDAATLLRDLELGEGPATSGVATALSPQTVTLSRRTLVGITTGAALVFAALAAAGVAWWLDRGEAPPLTTYRLTTAAGLESGASLSPNDRFLVYAARGEESFDLFLRSAHPDGEPLQLTHTPNLDEIEASFSANGTRLAYTAIGPDGGVGVLPATGGTTRWVAAEGSRPRWSPDDRRLLLQIGRSEPPPRDLQVVTLDGGEAAEPLSLRRLFDLEEPVHDGDWWGPDEVVAVVGNSEVWSFDLGSARREHLFTAEQEVRHLCSDLESRQLVLLLAGTDGWQPHVWRGGGGLRPIGSGGYTELTGCRQGQLVLTRSEQQMRILGAEFDSDGQILASSIVPVAAATGGEEQREFMPDLSPDGQSLGFISSRSGDLQVWMKAIDGVARRISTASGDHRWPAFSPNGRWLAYCAREVGDGDVLLYDLETDREVNLTHTANVYEGAPDWFPDGESLVINVRRGEQWDLARLLVPSGETILLTDDAAGDIDPAVSPDGGRIAFHRDGVLHLLDLASGELTPLVPGNTPRWRDDGSALLYQANGDLWALPMPFGDQPPRRLTYHPWPARRLEGVWKFSLRGQRLVYSVVEHRSGNVVLLAPEGSLVE